MLKIIDNKYRILCLIKELLAGKYKVLSDNMDDTFPSIWIEIIVKGSPKHAEYWYNKIDYSWFNASFESFKIKWKSLLL